MATIITIAEQFNRPITVGKNPTAEIGYHVMGTGDELLARDAVKKEMPALYDRELVPSSIRIERRDELLYHATVLYERRAPLALGDYSISVETGGGTQHVDFALSQRVYGASAPDSHGAIGINGDTIEGVDIIVPVYKWTIRRVIPAEWMSLAYMRTMAAITATVNDAPFWGFEAGEVLFEGATGSGQSVAAAEVTFRFASLPNQSNLQVGNGEIAGIQKYGWEHLSVRWESTEDNLAARLTKKPVGVYVSQVYRYSSFSVMGI